MIAVDVFSSQPSLCMNDVSSASHPFYTGTQKTVDNMGGRVEKFRNKFKRTAA